MQCRRDGEEGSRYKVPVPGGPEGGPGTNYVAHAFAFLGFIVICRLYKLTLSDQALLTLLMNQSFRFSVKIFSRSALAGGGGGGEGRKNVSPRSEPATGDLG